MKQCGIINASDGSEDSMIEYLKTNPDAKLIFETKSATDNSVRIPDELEEKDDLYALDEDSDFSWRDTDESN